MIQARESSVRTRKLKNTRTADCLHHSTKKNGVYALLNENPPGASHRQQAAHCSSVGHLSFACLESWWWCARRFAVGHRRNLHRRQVEDFHTKPHLIIQAKDTTTRKSQMKAHWMSKVSTAETQIHAKTITCLQRCTVS